MALINNHNVYDYYLSTYAKEAGTSRFDTHKKSELRGVYNRMVKTNKDAPLYKMNIDDDALNFVIDLKETARQMQNVVSSLTTEGSDIESVFYKKIAVSSNEDAVDVEYVGDEKITVNSQFLLHTVKNQNDIDFEIEKMVDYIDGMNSVNTIKII